MFRIPGPIYLFIYYQMGDDWMNKRKDACCSFQFEAVYYLSKQDTPLGVLNPRAPLSHPISSFARPSSLKRLRL